MSSSIFSETPSARPNGTDGDSNLVVVYTKNGISFDERAIENIMEEKSIASISVVRLTSPTPSMVDQEETERLEELERFLETATDREDSDADRDTDNDSQSGGDEFVSEKDHITGDDNDNTGGENNDDSTETETEAPKVKKRPGRKPKPPKKQKKRRKPKERPQIVGLSVEQFYADNSADFVVKSALKMAGVSVFKRTPETDAMMEIIKNDHNYTPFTSPEQMKAQKMAEKLAMERQAAQGRKFIVQTQSNVKILNAKQRFQVVPFSQVQTTVHQPPRQLQQQMPRQQLPKQLPRPPAAKKKMQIIVPGPRPVRTSVKVISPAEDIVEDDEDANSSATADEDNIDTEEHSEPSDESRESDNDRDSDIDFKMNNSRNSNKRKRIKKLSKRPQTQPIRGPAVHTPKTPLPPAQPQVSQLKRRKEQNESSLITPATGQIFQLTKAPATVIALGRGMPSRTFLKVRPTHKSLPPVEPLTPAKMRRTPMVQIGMRPPMPSRFATPTQPQEVKEIIINKNLSSPKGVFTNLNTLLADNNNKTTPTSTPEPVRQRIQTTPSTPKSSLSTLASSTPAIPKGFMPIGVETATSHKLPAQIVIETHQSSSELAAENDKQLDLINSIVQDELLKSTLVEQPPASADETIPKLVKMLESSAAGLNQVPDPKMESIHAAPQQNFTANMTTSATTAAVDNIDIASARLLDTPDEDEITADFLQHVVGLIEEDKQFEAEVVKQVLASTETGGLDAIANAVVPPIFEPASQQMPMITQPLANNYPPNIVTSTLATAPTASSTPARGIAAIAFASRPEVKVVRGNGRVIYLPPIEAPTTRAKRRAQNFPGTSTKSATATILDISNISFSEAALETSHLTNSSLDSDSFLPQVGGVVKTQLPRDVAGSVRRPKRSKKMDNHQANDTEASESQEDDDDPNKLWCICRQPHNNRFMICCDLCEDWYHGTCVSVTKSMGLEMENKSTIWSCPRCVKKQEEKNQPRITDMLLPKPTVEPAESVTLPKQLIETKATSEQQELPPKRPPTVAVTGAGAALSTNTNTPLARQTKRPLINKSKPQPKMLHQQQLHFVKLSSSSGTSTTDTPCVACKRPARLKSVYCSDECIRKYAQNAIQAQTAAKLPDPLPPAVAAQPPLANTLEAKKAKKKDLFEDVLRQADSVSKVERINVFERCSGRTITGHLAPSAQQLKKWLQDNPTFEVVQPGSQQALEIEKRQNKRLPELISPEPEITRVKSPLLSPTHKPFETPNRSTQLPAMLNTAKREKPVVKVPSATRRSPDQSQAERSGSRSQPDPIRFNVRRTLKDQLLARIKESQAAALPTDKSEWLEATEVEQFVKRVESEMYYSFGRDVSAKYKSKYRSLMFNIKDRKNKTLFEKICAKQVDPKQLVRMTPAELASQELAKWREEENRHQLDIIKKSELDLLSCAQNYMVKTHKGEELIKTKVDVTLPEEELESLETTAHKDDSKRTDHPSESSTTSTADVSSKELDRSTVKEKLSRPREKERGGDRDRDKERERDKRHKSHRHHHQSSAKRSRSRSSSRSRSLEKRSHKRHHHEDKEKEAPSRDKQPSKERSDKVQSPLLKKPAEKKTEPLLAFSLIDQILEGEKTVEEAANLIQHPVKQTPKALPVPAPVPVPVPVLVPVPVPVTTKTTEKSEVCAPTLDAYARYLQDLAMPALWSGNMKMVDVTDFNVVIYPVHGDTNRLGSLFPKNLDVIGRITGINVWDYLKKIKKSPTKEIVIVNLFPASIRDTAKFDSFFEYLDSRQRLGVLEGDSAHIRDFYIFPLGTRDKLPTVLQSSDSVPFYEDTQRPNTLLGIIVRCLTKRSLPPTTASNKTSKVSSKTRARTTFTPPSSPKRKRSTHSTSSKDDEFDIDAIIKAPIAKLQQTNVSVDAISSLDDPNAPYSPGGSSDDDVVPTANKDDLERKVDEINKQIAAQRMEIAGLLNVESSALGKPSSSSNVLANISIPPNLTTILASLKEKSDANAWATSSPKVSNKDDEYNPEDAITPSSSYSIANKKAESAPNTKSRLAQLSEAELLSMVPDNLVDLPPAKSSRHDEPPPPGV